MYKIGEFSSISKVTIKALRYYEKENLLLPAYVNEITGYRYYEGKQLIELSKIISLRQFGLSIKEIRKVLNKEDITDVLISRKTTIEKDLVLLNDELSKINILLKEKNMKNEIVLKDLPECIVYYKEGVIKDFSEITNFILSSGEECLAINPGIKCISPDYCFVNYLDGEYKESNIKIRYAQAVEKAGVENDDIKFMNLKPVKAVCIYHQGTYDGIRDAYTKIMKYIEDSGYEIADYPRECYIDGMWNKESVDEWLTEIQVPIK